MSARGLASFLITVTLICYGLTTSAKAQDKEPVIKSAQSSGITVSISKAIVSQRKVIIQFTASNDTQVRVYVRDAHLERSQEAFLGSGGKLESLSILGMEVCDDSATQCANSPSYHGDDLNRYSYIEPGSPGFIPFGFTYEGSAPISESDTVSFTVVLIARFASQKNPGQVGPTQTLRFNFAYVHLTAH